MRFQLPQPVRGQPLAVDVLYPGAGRVRQGGTHSGLPEAEANRMTAILDQNGIAVLEDSRGGEYVHRDGRPARLCAGR